MQFHKPLYETTTVVTLEEFRKLNHALSNRRLMAAVILAAEIILAVLLVLSIRNHGSSTQIYVIMLILLPGIAWFVPRYLERRMYLANETANNMVMKTQFYADHLEQHSKLGNSSVKYTDLKKIIETGTNFYLLVSKTQSIIIVKNHCHPKLSDFIHEMMK